MKHFIIKSTLTGTEGLLSVQNNTVSFVKTLYNSSNPFIDFSSLKGLLLSEVQKNLDYWQLEMKETPVDWQQPLYSDRLTMEQLWDKFPQLAKFVTYLDLEDWQQAGFYDWQDELFLPAIIDDTGIICLKDNKIKNSIITLMVRPFSDHLLVQWLVQWSEKGHWTEEYDIVEFADWLNNIEP